VLIVFWFFSNGKCLDIIFLVVLCSLRVYLTVFIKIATATLTYTKKKHFKKSKVAKLQYNFLSYIYMGNVFLQNMIKNLKKFFLCVLIANAFLR